ncbi:hypothetical protein GMB86_11400 [Terrilactibacillus sp. BCM23-1]|uniref:Uncharacterized protein n=1 Tax=Terrilactibacillus tamarindi TaxID=2599694 RepID=A0A6N8CRE4_9BACI|nr:hypothetical protein [Terrilactibacillus tamarindi]MTT32611.1 hypothetical protein [Terrilactibacillus tamarindi]
MSKQAMDTSEMTNNQNNGKTKEDFSFRLDLFELKLEQMERKVENKAERMISQEVQKQRLELENIYLAMQRIDEQMKTIDNELDQFAQKHQISTEQNSVYRFTPVKAKRLQPIHTGTLN